MVKFAVKNEDIKQWLPETYNSFIEDLRKSKSSSANKAEDKIRWAVEWGFFGKKTGSKEELIEKLEKKFKLTFDERVAEDTPKIKVTVFMEVGHYVRVDSSIDKEIPKFIKEMSVEVIKIMMLQEQKEVNDPVVKASLKEFEHLLDEIHVMDEKGQVVPKKEAPLNMDEVLDKINDTGMGSLTPRELKFLEKMSRG